MLAVGGVCNHLRQHCRITRIRGSALPYADIHADLYTDLHTDTNDLTHPIQHPASYQHVVIYGSRIGDLYLIF